MDSIYRVSGYSKLLEFAKDLQKVKGVNKDERNKQRDGSQKRELFKDIFERTQNTEEEKK